MFRILGFEHLVDLYNDISLSLNISSNNLKIVTLTISASILDNVGNGSMDFFFGLERFMNQNCFSTLFLNCLRIENFEYI